MEQFVNLDGSTLLADAGRLIARHGEGAGREARRLAARSRSDGNLVRFCRWRDVSRLVETLASDAVAGTVH